MERTAILCDLLGTRYPLMQGGMAHISDARLAAAVSNGGGLGIISAAAGDPEKLAAEIDLARTLTDKPFGVNIMLRSNNIAALAAVIAEKKVAVVTTGAGSPAEFIPMWRAAGDLHCSDGTAHAEGGCRCRCGRGYRIRRPCR